MARSSRSRGPHSPYRPGVFERWARFAHRRRGMVIGAWALILVGCIASAALFGGSFVTKFELPGSEVQRADDLLTARFAARAGGTADIVFQSPDGVTTGDAKTRIQAVLSDVANVPGVSAVESPYDQQGFISTDGTIARGVVHWTQTRDEVDTANVNQFLKIVDAANANGLTVEAGGDIVQSVEQPAFGSEAIGLVAAVVILLIAFGSVIAMGLPIGAAVFGLGGGFSLITVAALFVPFPSFAPEFAGMIGLGVGIDYSLLVVTRFREGLHHNRGVEESLVLALNTAGRAVVFAGIVVSVALLGLAMMGIPFITAMGVAGAIVVFMSVLVALTLLPAFLSLVGKRVDSWRLPFLHSTEGVDVNSGWYKLSRQIQRRPLPYMLSAIVLLLVLGSPVLSIRLGFTDAGNGPTNLHSRRAYDLLSKGFGPGFNGPLLMVADLAKGGDKDTVDQVLAKVKATPGVAQVAPAVFNQAGDTAIITVIPTTSPQDEHTKALVHQLRDHVIPTSISGTGAAVWVTGSNAAQIDIGDQIGQRMPFLFIGVIGISFLLLMAVFRSVLVALKAAVMNLLSIGAAYGVIVAVFQWGWGGSILGIEKGPVEVFLPMMFFAILFGLSMDYEVFLISRVREEYLKTKDNASAVSNGLAATARVITAAAAIMVAVFLSFVLGDDRIIKEFGIGLATAIFVDATIVRLVLVPSTMELLGDANWWLPKWLDKLLPKLDLEGPAVPRTAPEVAGSPAGGK